MDDPIATMEMMAVHPDGTRAPLIVEIGKPYSVDTEEWACPVSLKPLYPRLPDQHGVDSMQALCLALSLVFDLLSHFKEKGGALQYEDGEEHSINSYGFGRFKPIIQDDPTDE